MCDVTILESLAFFARILLEFYIHQPSRAVSDASSIAEWTPEQVKAWIASLFGDSVAVKFIEEEVDGITLLESKRLEEDSTLEYLGIKTIGRKERFKREVMALKPVSNGANLFFLG